MECLLLYRDKTFQSRWKWSTLGFVFCVYRWTAGTRKGRCQLEGMVWGVVMGQEGRERDALSIDYHTEHPCALAGLRLCRRTKPWFSTSFPRGRALETEDGGHPLPFPPLILCFCLSLPLSLSFSPSRWPVTWQQPCIKENYRTMQGASQEFEELFFFFKTGISYGRVLSYGGWTISAVTGTRNQREK